MPPRVGIQPEVNGTLTHDTDAPCAFYMMELLFRSLCSIACRQALRTRVSRIITTRNPLRVCRLEALSFGFGISTFGAGCLGRLHIVSTAFGRL